MSDIRASRHDWASSLLARLRGYLDRAAAFCIAPAPPILPPYRTARPPLSVAIRRVLFFAVTICVGIIYGFFYTILPASFLQFLVAPIALLALVVIWTLPDRAVEPPVKALSFLFFAFWLALTVWPRYLAISIPGLPWISFERLTAGPLTLLLLVVVSTSAKFRRESAAALAASPLITKMMVAFALLQAFSIFLSARPVTSFQKFADNQFMNTVTFFVGVYLFLKPGRALLWIRMMIGMAVFVAIIGIIEYFEQRILWAEHIPWFLKVDDESVLRTLGGQRRSSDGIYRAVSTFNVSLPFAEYLGITTPFLIHIFVTTKRNIVRFLCVAADLVLLAAILFTGARLGMVASLFAHAVYGLIWAIRRWRTDKSSIMGPAITLGYPAILVAVGIVVMTVGRVRNAVVGHGGHTASNNAREDQYALFVDDFIARFPLGYGPGQSGDTLDYISPSGVSTVDAYVITIGIDYGLFGLIFFFGMLVGAIINASRIGAQKRTEELGYAHPISLSLGAFFLIKLVLSQEENTPIFYMMLAMVVAFQYRFFQGEGLPEGAPNPSVVAEPRLLSGRRGGRAAIATARR